MTVPPLFAPVLPPAPASARPAQGDGPSDLAGLFALLLAGIPLAQAVVAHGADPSAPPAPGLRSVLAGDLPQAVPATASTQQSTLVSGVIGPAADARPPVSPLPVTTSAPVPAEFAPASASPQLASRNPDAQHAGPFYAPTPDLTQAAPYLSLAEPGRAFMQTPSVAAPPPLTAAVAPLDAVQTKSASGARPEMTSIALTADTTAPVALPSLPLQSGADSAVARPAAARVRSLVAATGRATAAPALEARRPHASILAPTAGSPAAAGDQPATSDQAWLEPGSEAADAAAPRADHAVSDPARAPAPGRSVPPAPVFQIGMQIAKAVPGRIDRLVV
jgi:hypothetical protein